MTPEEGEVMAALLGAVRRLHFGAGDQSYRHGGCEVCQLVSLVEGFLGGPPARPFLLRSPGVPRATR